MLGVVYELTDVLVKQAKMLNEVIKAENCIKVGTVAAN